MKDINGKLSTDIDKALKKLMQKVGGEGLDPETQVKIINSAISWEKVKHNIDDSSGGFDPSQF